MIADLEKRMRAAAGRSRIRGGGAAARRDPPARAGRSRPRASASGSGARPRGRSTPGAPASRPARRCAPRSAPRQVTRRQRRVRADAASQEVTGAFPTPPLPKAALVTGGGAAHRPRLRAGAGRSRLGRRRALPSHRAPRRGRSRPRSRDSGGRAVALAADLADEAPSRRCCRAAAAALGPLGCLVNNASIFEQRYGADGDPRELGPRTSTINLRAPFVLMQEFARQLPRRRRRRGRQPPRRAGVEPDAAFRLLHPEQGRAVDADPDDGAGAGAAHPGQRHRPRPDLAEPAPERRSSSPQRCRAMPLRRGTAPEEIAAALRFILAAPAMTGQMIALDGGQHLGWAPAAATRRRSNSTAMRRPDAATKCLGLSLGIVRICGAMPKLFTASVTDA